MQGCDICMTADVQTQLTLTRATISKLITLITSAEVRSFLVDASLVAVVPRIERAFIRVYKDSKTYSNLLQSMRESHVSLVVVVFIYDFSFGFLLVQNGVCNHLIFLTDPIFNCKPTFGISIIVNLLFNSIFH